MSEIQATGSDFSAKYNAAGNGDIIVLSGEARPGTLRLRNGVGVKGGAIVGATLTGTSTGKFDHVTFNGSCFSPDNGPLILDWCTAVNFAGLPNPGAGQFIRSSTHGGGWVADGARVTNSVFDDLSGWAIGAWLLKNFIARFNHFHCANAIKADAFQDFHENVWIEQNDFDGIARMGTELQGRARNLWFQWNYFRNPRYGARNDSCLMWSNILHGRDEHDLYYRYNTCDARDDGGENYTRLMFEMGNATLVEHNLCLNVGTVTSCFMGDSSGPQPQNVILPSYVRNNKIVKSRYGQGSSYGQYPALCAYSNNGPNVQLPTDIKGIGVIPGPGKDITSGTTFPPPDPPPPPTPEWAAPTYDVTGDTTATLKWNASRPNWQSYRVDVRATGDPDPGWHVLGSVVGLTADIVGLHPGWEMSFRISDGTTTTAAATKRQSGDPATGTHSPALKGTTIPPDPPPTPDVIEVAFTEVLAFTIDGKDNALTRNIPILVDTKARTAKRKA